MAARGGIASTHRGNAAAEDARAQHGERFERLDFERLLADISGRLANVSGAAVLGEIEASLGMLVDFLGYDRCTYSELADWAKIPTEMNFSSGKYLHCRAVQVSG